MQVLKELRSDPTKKIMNSDKGNATVILDSNTYDKKMLDMQSNPEVYRPITSNSNPILTIQKVNQILNQFAKDQKITVPVYYHLKCDKGVTPKIYGLTKIHKESVSLRPIVSFIGSPLYNLSKFLVDILSPIVNLKFCVKNSSQFIHKISRVKLNPDERICHLMLPINEVKILIFNLLSKDRNLCKRTKLTVQDIMLCLELCFNFTVFSFKNTLYRQVFGAPMGSCISPVVANIFMAYLEKTAINIFHTPLTPWVRFVDDTFCVIKRSCVGEFYDRLSGISSFIKFTYELDVDGRLPFLDVLVTRQHNGAQTTTIITSPHTQIATYKSLHTTLNITNFL